MNKLKSIDLVKKLAEEEHLSVDTVVAIIKSQFQFTASIIKKVDRFNDTEFDVIMVTNFGKFAVTEGKQKGMLTRLRNYKKEHGTSITTEQQPSN